MVWLWMVQYNMEWYGKIWYGMVGYDTNVTNGMVWHGMVWYGMVRYRWSGLRSTRGSPCRGLIRDWELSPAKLNHCLQLAFLPSAPSALHRAQGFGFLYVRHTVHINQPLFVMSIFLQDGVFFSVHTCLSIN